MSKIAILVDMQVGFINKEIKYVLDNTIEYLKGSNFDTVIATRYINYDNSYFEKIMEWSDLKKESEYAICEELVPYINVVVDKTLATCVNMNFLQRLVQLNGGSYPSEVYIFGVDTACCVLKTCADLVEANIRPLVVEACCGSPVGDEYHKAGLMCLEMLIGADNIIKESKQEGVVLGEI